MFLPSHDVVVLFLLRSYHLLLCLLVITSMTQDIKLLKTQCLHCQSHIVGEVLVCQGCQVVEYCFQEHQNAGRMVHQTDCKQIQELRANHQEQARALREDPDGDLFETGSVFWSIAETGPYREACIALLEKLSRIRTVKACVAASEYGLEYLHRNWGVDHRGARHRIATLWIRLGKDQDAYDFLKWYATTAKDPYYSWTGLYDLKDEDAMESLQAGRWHEEVTHLSTMASITLIKLRIWFNLRWLLNTSILACKLPQEILDYIRERHVATEIVAANQEVLRDVRNGKDAESLYMRPLEQQLSEMFHAIRRKSAEFWPAIVRGQSLEDRFEDQSDEEWILVVAVSSGREAWDETPGAIEWVKEQLESCSGSTSDALKADEVRTNYLQRLSLDLIRPDWL